MKKEVFQKARRQIESAFRSNNPSLRETVVSAFAELTFPNDRNLLREALQDAHEYVRIAAALSWAGRKDLSGGPALQDILENTPTPSGPNPVLVQFQSIAVAKKRSAAAKALGSLGDAKSKAVLLRARRDKDPRVRDAVSVGLARLGEKSELAVFHAALGNADEGIRQAAVEALADVGHPESQIHFLKALQDSAGAVRVGALRGLARLKNPAVWRDVAARVRDSDALVREVAAETLGLTGNPEATAALLPLLDDENGFVRIAAAKALGRLGNLSGITVLRDFLSDSDADVRVRAIEGLAVFQGEAEWGSAAGLLDDPEERVRLAAALVIWKKGGTR